MKDWLWLGNQGRKMVSAMETSHVFYTIRMIWNNSVPASHRVGTYARREFSEQLTTAYLRDSFKHLVAQMALRGPSGLNLSQRTELVQILQKFTQHPGLQHCIGKVPRRNSEENAFASADAEFPDYDHH